MTAPSEMNQLHIVAVTLLALVLVWLALAFRYGGVLVIFGRIVVGPTGPKSALSAAAEQDNAPSWSCPVFVEC